MKHSVAGASAIAMATHASICGVSKCRVRTMLMAAHSPQRLWILNKSAIPAARDPSHGSVVVNRSLMRSLVGAHVFVRSRRRDINCSGSRTKGHQAAIQNDNFGGSRVRRLLDGSRPAAVSRLVIAVVVDAVNGITGAGPIPHVLKEVLELRPSLANRDATAPVVMERAGFLVGAAGKHRRPYPVCGAIRHSMASSGFPGRKVLLKETAAGFDASKSDRGFFGGERAATIALDGAVISVMALDAVFEDNKTIKRAERQWVSRGHVCHLPSRGITHG